MCIMIHEGRIGTVWCGGVIPVCGTVSSKALPLVAFHKGDFGVHQFFKPELPNRSN